ncbi:hypothetical protein [Pontibacter ummariensis]|nr:hypothetical protein [Pontibacter ummariensis]
MQIQKRIVSRFWWVWLVAIAIVVFVILATLEFAPFLFMDELMNVDLGRTILNPKTSWSVAWMTEENKPVYLLTYLGPVLQELSYQVAGELGPRVSALIGAVAAATALVGWLLARGTAKIAALALGIAFILDPLFVQAYTTGRVDGWAMALCLSSCGVLRYVALYQLQGHSINRYVFLSSTLAVLALFTWPSAGFLIPLILIEFLFLLKKKVSLSGSWQDAVVPAASFITGCLVTSLLLLVPIVPQLYDLLGSMIEALKVNLRHGGEASDQGGGGLSITASFIEILRVLKFTPALLLMALLGVVRKRQPEVLIGGLVAVLLMMSTVVYISRVQYLLPYLVLSAATLFSFKTVGHKASLINTSALVLVLFWSVGLTIIARTIVALHKSEERNRELISRTARSMIGPGNHSVALFNSFEFYYAGRSLGWKMYAPYKPAFADISLEMMQRSLSHADYAIIPQEHLTKEFEDLLKDEGMYLAGAYLFYKEPYEKDYVKDHSKTTNIDRVHIVYRILRQPYGPYRLYARENKSAS